MADDQATGWAAIVLAEAAVAYAYGIAGPQLAPDQRTTAKALYDSHERARDDALLRLTAGGAAPVAIPTFFAIPDAADTEAGARPFLASVESRLAESYADLIAVLPLPERQTALGPSLLATQRSLAWGAAPGPWGAQDPDPQP